VIDAVTLGGVSTDHDVYFERVVPHAGFTVAHGREVVAAIGATIDEVLNAGTAIGAAFVQDTDEAGLLKNYMEWFFRIPSPDPDALLTSSVLEPMQLVVDQGVAGAQNTIVDELRALGGSPN